MWKNIFLESCLLSALIFGGLYINAYYIKGELYEDNIATFAALSDLNQPYSCTAWANLAPNGGGDIVHDVGYGMFNLFNSQNGFPSFAFVDHNMTVYHKSNSAGTYSTKLKIQEMVPALQIYI